MLYGRRLDQSLQHVDGSRYALVHAVAKRARQITLWLTADPAELRAEAAPPPAPGELMSRDPVALAEAEILEGEVKVRWDPEGRADERDTGELDQIETDPLLIEGLGGDDDEDAVVGGDDESRITPALAQVLNGEGDLEGDDDTATTTTTTTTTAAAAAPALAADRSEEADDTLSLVDDGGGDDDGIEEISLEDVEEPDDDDDEEVLD